jgi:hypothetical protein
VARKREACLVASHPAAARAESNRRVDLLADLHELIAQVDQR